MHDCPICGSSNVFVEKSPAKTTIKYTCQACGHIWTTGTNPFTVFTLLSLGLGFGVAGWKLLDEVLKDRKK